MWRSYSFFPFSMQKVENQLRQPTEEEADFLEWLLKITLTHFEVRNGFSSIYRTNSENNNLIAEYCHANIKYIELANSNDIWIKQTKCNQIKKLGKEIKDITVSLRFIASLYNQMGRAANTSSSKLDYSFYEANAELVHQIHLLNSKICGFIEGNYFRSRVDFSNEARARFDKLILQFPEVKQKKNFVKEVREIDVIDMFIICLGSNKLFDAYDNDQALSG